MLSPGSPGMEEMLGCVYTFPGLKAFQPFLVS